MKSMLWSLPGIAIGGALGWLALRGAVSEDLLASLSALDWRLLVLAVAAVTFAGFLQAYRWKLLLPKEKVSTTRLFVVKEMGQGLNNISPIRVLAEVAQTAMLTRRYGISGPKVVSSLLMSRLFDLLVTVNLVGVGMIILPQLSGYRPLVAPLWGMTGVALLAFSISDQYWLSVAILVVVGVGQAGRMSLSNVLIQSYVDDAYRGRVMGIFMMEFSLMSLGMYGAGILASYLGPQLTVGGSAVALIALSGGLLLFAPTYRKLD